MGVVIVKGGRVIDPANKLDRVVDLYLSGGRVAGIGSLEGTVTSKVPPVVIDATGCVVAPGFVDIHVHLREPGQEGKETIASGSRAGLAGGYTSLACMANTLPVNDSAVTTGWIAQRALDSGAPARIFPVGAVTKGLQGQELAELRSMREAGAVAFSDDGMPVLSAGLYRRAMELAADLGVPVISHCEDPTLTGGGCMHEGPVATELGLPGIPSSSESVMVARDLLLARATGARLHLAHLSTAEGVALVREAKARGVSVTAEAAPHHFSLTDEVVKGYRTECKMSPPLRPQADVEAVLAGLADGTIDAIATDHAPHGPTEKDCEFGRAANGVIGLETALPLVLARVKDGRLTLPRAIELLTSGPARVLGLKAGSLAVGEPADVTVFDPEARWTYEKPLSRSRNSPWLGESMTGKVRQVIAGGLPWTPEAPS